MMSGRLAGKVIVVAGAGGIGDATSHGGPELLSAGESRQEEDRDPGATQMSKWCDKHREQDSVVNVPGGTFGRW